MEKTYTESKSPALMEMQVDVPRCIREASQIIAPYWPLDSFIANNALANLEHLPFHQAVRDARKMGRGQGFLPLTTYRTFFTQRRISEQDISSAIVALQQTLALPTSIELGTRTLPLQQVYSAWLRQEETPEKVKAGKSELWKVVSQSLPAAHPVWSEDVQEEGKQEETPVTSEITTMVNNQMVLWCAAFLDEGQAGWSMPGREKGFYQCWKDLAGEGGIFSFLGDRTLHKSIRDLPDEADATLELCLQGLARHLSPSAASDIQMFWTEQFMRHLAQLPGWASIIRWREEHPESLWQQRYPITLTDYLAVRLFYELTYLEMHARQPSHIKSVLTSLFTGKGKEREPEQTKELIARLVVLCDIVHLQAQEIAELPATHFSRLLQLASSWSVEKQQVLWQKAYELHYRDHLLTTLRAHKTVEPKTAAAQKAQVQALFCIDVRSEGMRRCIETLGPYETYGVAGFFGVPMLYHPFGASGNLTLAPALITPTSHVSELPRANARTISKQNLSGNALIHSWHLLIHALREHLLTPFAFVEMVGGFFLFPLLGKTLLPDRWKQLQNRITEKLLPRVPTEPSILTDLSVPGMSREEQAGMVGNMLRGIGLTSNFARLILLCGHGSQSENNPYASSLDCGACGGNAGGNSAFVTASILNSPAIRALLAEQGITIPEESMFLAGEHNTTTDEIRILNEDQVPASHAAELQQLKQDLARAGKDNASLRLLNLPDASQGQQNVTRHVQQRATDWSQIRPEWGLARNAAFLCGRRSLTEQLDLEGRVFLHSYDQGQDPDGSILESIMTAPLVVGEWINMQYYFSTIDNQAFGSDTKLLHNVVGQIGVMQGQQSDLLIGLPMQSVMYGNNDLYHEPMRLLAIIEADPERIATILVRHEQLNNLVKNQWITLIAYDSSTTAAYEFASATSWYAL
ncbi:DUF2309 domain-containing protein [Dictyobacter aurantiacus]|uniref:Probable inorganic carbon transporter subunit DabA n=1 Tax=Dictyobacter aurantiacus TaxID=1936993 RepID=A0A401ZIY9_9CHLR|nr:DUF2309 domain-containing protein [Dictyobacter aurantiacus]GCE06798.1 UPF0753 protein [Dictyobacter aurantiacus]